MHKKRRWGKLCWIILPSSRFLSRTCINWKSMNTSISLTPASHVGTPSHTLTHTHPPSHPLPHTHTHRDRPTCVFHLHVFTTLCLLQFDMILYEITLSNLNCHHYPLPLPPHPPTNRPPLPVCISIPCLSFILIHFLKPTYNPISNLKPSHFLNLFLNQPHSPEPFELLPS